MTYKVIVRPEAELEIQEEFDWYEKQSKGLGAEFLRAADACLSGVQHNSDAYQIAHGEVHREQKYGVGTEGTRYSERHNLNFGPHVTR